MNVQDGAQKKALLLNYLDDEAYDVHINLSTGRPDETYDAVVALLTDNFRHKIILHMNIMYFKMLDKQGREHSSVLHTCERTSGEV